MLERAMPLILAFMVLGAPAKASPPFESSVVFQASASRFLLRVHRQITMRTHVEDLEGHLLVDLDRPLKRCMGVDRLRFHLHLLDETGRQVTEIHGEMLQGDRSLRIPFRLPAPGHYALMVSGDDIDAGPARIRFYPKPQVFLGLLAGEPRQIVQR
ncbi:MAG: hypothetical protein ACE5ID_01415 [Acidobacteriota bacterium]